MSEEVESYPSVEAAVDAYRKTEQAGIEDWLGRDVRRIPRKLDVDTLDVERDLGTDFELTYQDIYQVNFNHKPTGVRLAILKKKGQHRHIPRSYRVWLLRGLIQMKYEVGSVEEAIDRIKRTNIAKEFEEPPEEGDKNDYRGRDGKVVVDGWELEIIKEKHGVRLLRENLETRSYKKPRYQYYVQYHDEGKWQRPEAKVSFTRAKDEFESQSKYPYTPKLKRDPRQTRKEVGG